MEIRRVLAFFALSLAILIGWQQFVVPRFVPQPAAPEARQDRPLPEPNGDAARRPDEAAADREAGLPDEAVADREDAVADREDAPEEPDLRLPRNPHRQVELGSLDPDSGYFQRATLTTRGAAVVTVELNDPRYRNLEDRDQPLRVVDTIAVRDLDGMRVHHTLDTALHQIDGELAALGTSSTELDWEVADLRQEADGTHSAVTFRLRVPGSRFEAIKHYELRPVDPRDHQVSTEKAAREQIPDGYELRLDLTVRNLTDQPQSVTYTLQGPVGVPLENEANTRIFRAVRMGFLREDGGLKAQIASAKEVAEADDARREVWKTPFQYIGVDVQYFAALLIPREDQLQNDYIAEARAMLLRRGDPVAHSDISLRLDSHLLDLAPAGAEGDAVTHAWTLYSGPKRESLLDAYRAGDIIEFGWFAMIGRGMLWLLRFFHDTLLLPYGLAIIMLTVVVRGLMFPLSMKQAINAKKMKELQPKLAEIKKKYAGDREKQARAQMELFRKHNHNPFAGCLPIFIQLPIFIGLYNALHASVDLRMAPFLWADNLAAPDALFSWVINVPYLGQHFNLLPILTVVLFVVQMKMFTPPPPPDDEQAQMMHKMMKWMMVFMGFIFYHAPAGLCVYFIASSLWGIGERKLLDLGKQDANAALAADGDTPKQGRLAANGAAPRKEEPASNGRAGKPRRSKKKSRSRR